MRHLVTGAALAAAVSIAVPAWAQTAEQLNAQELNRLSTPQATFQPT